MVEQVSGRGLQRAVLFLNDGKTRLVPASQIAEWDTLVLALHVDFDLSLNNVEDDAIATRTSLAVGVDGVLRLPPSRRHLLGSNSPSGHIWRFAAA